MLVAAGRDDSLKGRRTYAILRMIVDLGLRRTTICALDISEVDLCAQTIHVKCAHEKRHRKGSRAGYLCGYSTMARKARNAQRLKSSSRSSSISFLDVMPGSLERRFYGIVSELSAGVGFRTGPTTCVQTQLSKQLNTPRRLDCH